MSLHDSPLLQLMQVQIGEEGRAAPFPSRQDLEERGTAHLQIFGMPPSRVMSSVGPGPLDIEPDQRCSERPQRPNTKPRDRFPSPSAQAGYLAEEIPSKGLPPKAVSATNGHKTCTGQVSLQLPHLDNQTRTLNRIHKQQNNSHTSTLVSIGFHVAYSSCSAA